MQDPDTSHAVHCDYSALAAELYDALRGEDVLAGEYEFYACALSALPGPHLELGCGTGRILLRLIAAGLDVEGLDNSPDMLAICRRKGEARGLCPILHLQPMEVMDLRRRYGALFVPLASMMLLDDAAFDAALIGCHRHLRPGGQLFFSVYRRPSGPVLSAWRELGELERDGEAICVSHQCEPGIDDNVLIESFRFNSPARGATRAVHHIALHFREPEGICASLAARGFNSVEILGDHRDVHHTSDSRVLLFQATRV
jgi:SAM-dependent methyltransferase